MEYYILKLYEEAKQRCSDVEVGLVRFDSKVKRWVIGCLIVMFISCAEIIITVILFPKQLWHAIGIIICIIVASILFLIDSKYQKEHMRECVDSQKKKLEILETVLVNEFQINSKEKVEALINIYQENLDRKQGENKKRRGIIATILTAFAGVLSISFQNMGLIGIDFINWMYLAIILLTIMLVVIFGINVDIYFDPLKKKYEIMVRDLKELLLLKYIGN